MPERFSCLLDYIDNRILRTSKSARKRQGRRSRGTPTPPRYGYLTHHLPRKVTLARISNSATNKQVQILETRGKKTQLYNTIIRCLGLGGRKKHTHTTDKLFLQVQTSTEGAAAPSASFPPSTGPGPASDGDTGGRISTLREDASTALGPPRPGSPQGFRAERTPRRPLRSLSQLSPEDLSPAHGLGSVTPGLVPPADDLAKLQPPPLHLLGQGSHVLPCR
jgi:hypothetical protein